MTSFRISRLTVSRLATGIAGVALILGLAACTPETPVAQPPAIETPTPGASVTPTPTPTVEPSEPTEASCEGLLDVTTLDAILGTGFDVLPVNGYVEKIRAEGSPYALFDEYDGLVCPVNNGSRVTELYGYSPITPDQQATQEARLASEGWTSSDHNGGTLYVTSPAEDIVFAYYFRNGYWWCGYDAGVIDMIVANSPAS